VRVIAGEALGARAVIEHAHPIVYQDWTIESGADVTSRFRASNKRWTYFRDRCSSERRQGDSRRAAALLGEGDGVRFRGAPGAGRLLLLAGVPIGEPVARYGPFVMSSNRRSRRPCATTRAAAWERSPAPPKSGEGAG